MSNRQNEMDGLVAEWQAATGWWMNHLGTPTTEAVNWQPFNRSHSIGGVLLHIADTEGLWIEEHLAGRPRSTDERKALSVGTNLPEKGAWVLPPGWEFGKYLDTLNWVRQRSIRTLKEFSNPEHVFEGPEGQTTIRSAIKHLQLHEAYHAGQAVLHRIHHGWGGIEPA